MKKLYHRRLTVVWAFVGDDTVVYDVKGVLPKESVDRRQ